MKKNGHLSGREIELIYEASGILAKYLKKDFTIKDLAGMVMLSEKKLKQGFKDEFGMGVHGFQRAVRLEKVKIMLIQDRPLKAIVKSTGFKSESGLSKTFKKVFGVTTTAWKQNYKQLDRAL